jgi:hypothetical protein
MFSLKSMTKLEDLTEVIVMDLPPSRGERYEINILCTAGGGGGEGYAKLVTISGHKKSTYINKLNWSAKHNHGLLFFSPLLHPK